MSFCTCHEPLVFGHRCLEQPTGDMWPGNDTPTVVPGDLLALERRTDDVRAMIAELALANEQYQAALNHAAVLVPVPERDTYTWIDMIKAMRRGRRA